MQHTLRSALLTLIGLSAIGLISWHVIGQIATDSIRSAWILPAAILIHLVQLFLSALSWRKLLKTGSAWQVFQLRWIREAVNSLLPLAQVSGLLVSVRLSGRLGISKTFATASATVDIVTEAIAQALFIILCLLLLVLLGRYSVDAKVLQSIVAVFASLLVVLLAVGVAWKTPVRQWLLSLSDRFPQRLTEALRRAKRETVMLLRDRSRSAAAIAFHFVSWLLGLVEVYVILWAFGIRITVAQALIIECLGTTARTIGFAIPAGIGAQEGGYVVACALFGIGPAAAVALSIMKRVRELLVGILGLLLWQKMETAQ